MTTDQQHRMVTRRGFVKDTGVLIGGVTAASALSLASTSAAGNPQQIRVPHEVLGRTGVKVSRLGVGCAWLKKKHIGLDDIRKMLDRALELGVNYLDVAPNYGDAETGFSEEKMGPTIRDIRDRVFLVTKTEEPTYEGTWKLLRQSMARLQTDYFDLVHLHNFGNESRFSDIKFTFSDQGALGALREAKQKGVVRFIGASGHLHPARFHDVLDTGEIDVLMNVVNFVVQHTYDFESKVWARARRENIGLVAMKVLGGASKTLHGFRLPTDQYDNAIRYALSIPSLACAVIGIENLSELEQAAKAVTNLKPLTDQEANELARLGLELAATEPWKAVYGTPLT